MQVKYIVADVRLSELHTQRVKVPVWEFPILQAIHDANITAAGEETILRIRVPDAADEFTRLAQRYREPEPGQPPYVAAVYGLFGPGVIALGNAINAAVIEPPKARAKRNKVDDNDPLLAGTA